MENFKIWSTEKFGIEISEKQLAQFSAYQIFLQEQNQFMNLTAITETNEIWIKHFLDSISIELTVKPGTCLIDLGTGAGFPGIPLKILYPQLRLTLLDSDVSKIIFLKRLVFELELDKVEFVNEDFSEYCLKKKKFDYVVWRAVTNLKRAIPIAKKLVNGPGTMIFQKGPNYLEELHLVNDPEVKLVQTQTYELPVSGGERVNLYFQLSGKPAVRKVYGQQNSGKSGYYPDKNKRYPAPKKALKKQ